MQLTETPRGVQSRKHTSSKERRGKFEDPAIVLQTDDAGKTETVKCPTDVPVEGDSGGIDADDLEEERPNKGVDEALGLLRSGDNTLGSVMESTDGEGRGRGGGEGQLLLNDVVSAERNDEEYPEETSSSRESYQLSGIPLRRVGEEAECVHGGYSGNEENADTTSSC